jgi:hypothetical protein
MSRKKTILTAALAVLFASGMWSLREARAFDNVIECAVNTECCCNPICSGTLKEKREAARNALTCIVQACNPSNFDQSPAGFWGDLTKSVVKSSTTGLSVCCDPNFPAPNSCP